MELTVLDFVWRIFQNLHRKFFTQKLLLFTLNLNGKNEIEKAIFISFSNRWIFNLFIFHFKKFIFESIFIYLKRVCVMFRVFVQKIGFFRKNDRFSTKSILLSLFQTLSKIYKKAKAWSPLLSSFQTLKNWKNCRALDYLNSLK